MKALKVLVLLMTLLLVAGLGLVGYGVLNRAPHAKAGHSDVATVPASDFGEVTVPLPAGARIEQMAVAGDRVVLRLVGGGPERLVVLDPAGGRVAGGFVLVPAAAK